MKMNKISSFKISALIYVFFLLVSCSKKCPDNEQIAAIRNAKTVKINWEGHEMVTNKYLLSKDGPIYDITVTLLEYCGLKVVENCNFSSDLVLLIESNWKSEEREYDVFEEHRSPLGIPPPEYKGKQRLSTGGILKGTATFKYAGMPDYKFKFKAEIGAPQVINYGIGDPKLDAFYHEESYVNKLINTLDGIYGIDFLKRTLLSNSPKLNYGEDFHDFNTHNKRLTRYAIDILKNKYQFDFTEFLIFKIKEPDNCKKVVDLIDYSDLHVDQRIIEPLISILNYEYLSNFGFLEKDNSSSYYPAEDILRWGIRDLNNLDQNWRDKSFGEALITDWIFILNNGDIKDKIIAAQLLRIINDTRAIQPLIGILKDINQNKHKYHSYNFGDLSGALRNEILETLTSISGQRFDNNIEDWQIWWDKNRDIIGLVGKEQ